MPEGCCDIDFCIVPEDGCYQPSTGGYKKMWIVPPCDVTMGYSPLAGYAKGQITTFTLAVGAFLREVQFDTRIDGTVLNATWSKENSTWVVNGVWRLDYKDPETRAKIKRLLGAQFILIALREDDQFLVAGDNVKGCRMSEVVDDNGQVNPSSAFFQMTFEQFGKDGLVPLNLSTGPSTDPATIYSETLAEVQEMAACP